MEPPPSDANYELLWRVQSETEREATVRIPVGRATAWLLDEGTAANIHHDLSIVSEKFSLNARPLISDKGMESIILTGLPSAIAQARPDTRKEVVDLLNYYRDRDGKRKREDVDASAMTDEVSAVASALDASTVKKMELPAHVKDIRQFQYHDHTADPGRCICSSLRWDMDLKKHEQGTEIKAITMHMMKILDPTSMLTEDGKSERQEAAEAEFPRSFATVCHEDPDYCAWAMAQPQPSPAMAEFVRYLDSLGLSDVFAAKRRRRSVATPARNTVQHAPLERPNRTSWMTWMTLEGANGLQQQAPPPRDSPPQWAPGIHPAYLAAAQAAPAAPAAAAPAVAPSGQFGGWKQGVQMEHETRSFQPRGLGLRFLCARGRPRSVFQMITGCAESALQLSEVVNGSAALFGSWACEILRKQARQSMLLRLPTSLSQKQLHQYIAHMIKAQAGNQIKIFTSTASPEEAEELKKMVGEETDFEDFDVLERLTVISGREGRPGEAVLAENGACALAEAARDAGEDALLLLDLEQLFKVWNLLAEVSAAEHLTELADNNLNKEINGLTEETR
eukprot:g27810.t1